MSALRVPRTLAERLGNEGTNGLVTPLESERGAWTENVLTLATERFEKRLTTEMSAFRVEVAREIAALRVDVTREISGVRVDVANVRADVLKWSLVFWIGQLTAMAGLLAFMLRGLTRS